MLSLGLTPDSHIQAQLQVKHTLNSQKKNNKEGEPLLIGVLDVKAAFDTVPWEGVQDGIEKSKHRNS